MISVMLPTYGRPSHCIESIKSLIDNCSTIDNFDIVIAYDLEDKHSYQLIVDAVSDRVSLRGIEFEKRYGYSELYQYYNAIALSCSYAEWLFLWNDDAVMKTDGWDEKILLYSGQFLLLAPVPEKAKRNKHSTATLFPIFPYKWVEITGRVSAHTANDTWVEKIAAEIGIFRRIDIDIFHYRLQDKTTEQKESIKGPMFDVSFKSKGMIAERRIDSDKLLSYLTEIGAMS